MVVGLLGVSGIIPSKLKASSFLLEKFPSAKNNETADVGNPTSVSSIIFPIGREKKSGSPLECL